MMDAKHANQPITPKPTEDMITSNKKKRKMRNKSPPSNLKTTSTPIHHAKPSFAPATKKQKRLAPQSPPSTSTLSAPNFLPQPSSDPTATVTLMASASPSLETLASKTPTRILLDAVTILTHLNQRIAHLQTHIAIYESGFQKTKARVEELRPENQDVGVDVDVGRMRKWMDTYARLVALASEHLVEVFVLEQALRDVFEEYSGREKKAVDLEGYLERAGAEFKKMKRGYGRVHFPLLRVFDSGLMERMVEEVLEGKGWSGDMDGA